MKKIISLLVVILAISSLTSCGIGGFVDALAGQLAQAKISADFEDALDLGNLEQVKEAVDNGADVNNGCGGSPLLYSMDESQDFIPEYLLSKGADPNFIDGEGMSILMYTVGGRKDGLNIANVTRNNNYLTLLNDKRTDVNLTGKRGLTALDYACRDNGDVTIVNNLIKHGAQITAVTMNCAMEGFRSGFCDVSVVKLVYDSLIKQQTDFSIDPAIEAAIQGNTQELILLINEGDVRQEDRQVVMLLTCAFGDAEALKALADESIDINKPLRDMTYLGIACSYGKLESIEYLLSRGANFEWGQNPEYSAIANALEHARLDIAEYLMNNGEELPVRASGSFGGHPDVLERACRNGSIDTVKWIFVHGYPLTEENLFLAMYAAARDNQIEMLEFLVCDMNANINSMFHNSSVLGDAVRFSSLETVTFLVENGAEVNGVENTRLTPVQGAAMSNRPEILLYLLEKGADVNIIGSSDGRESNHALTYAIRYGYFDVVKILVENGADIYYKEGWADGKDTPLEIAEASGSQRIFDYLKNAQVDK